jgi:HEAT repeat protein
MYSDDDLNLLDPDTTLDSPLDHMAPLDAPEAEAAKPDVGEMLALLTSTEMTQRMMAARAFCELQDSRAIPHLIRFLSEGCPLLRVSAAYALGRNPSPDAVEPLIRQYDLDLNGYVRKGVVWALGNCRDRRSLDSLIEALATDIAAVRLWAASSLGQLGIIDDETATKALEPLAKALAQDSLSAVRSNCAWALGQICQILPLNDAYRQGIDALISALSDLDLGVQEDAKQALLKLGDPTGLQAIEELELEGLL